MTALRLEGVSKRFDGVTAVNDISFELADQPIEETFSRLRSLSRQTLVELVSGPSGWKNITDDMRLATSCLQGDDGAGAFGALNDPALIAGGLALDARLQSFMPASLST